MRCFPKQHYAETFWPTTPPLGVTDEPIRNELPEQPIQTPNYGYQTLQASAEIDWLDNLHRSSILRSLQTMNNEPDLLVGTMAAHAGHFQQPLM